MFKGTGITRRVDDIGRIIIPSDIRRRYHIKEGDSVEFGENPDTIELRRYSPVARFDDQVKTIVHAFSDAMKMPVVLCDTYKVVTCKNTASYDNQCISEELYRCMKEPNEDSSGVFFLKEHETMSSKIVWIRGVNDIIGALIIPESSKETTQTHEDYLKICAKVIERVVS